MRNERPYKVGFGLTLALATTLLGGTSALAFPAPMDTTTTSGPASILPPPPGAPNRNYSDPVDGTVIMASPTTGRNVRVPAVDSQQAAPQRLDQNAISIVRSPATGRNARVPAF